MSNVDVDSHKLTIFSLSLTTRNMTDYGKNYVKYCGIKLLVNNIKTFQDSIQISHVMLGGFYRNQDYPAK